MEFPSVHRYAFGHVLTSLAAFSVRRSHWKARSARIYYNCHPQPQIRQIEVINGMCAPFSIHSLNSTTLDNKHQMCIEQASDAKRWAATTQWTLFSCFSLCLIKTKIVRCRPQTKRKNRSSQANQSQFMHQKNTRSKVNFIYIASCSASIRAEKELYPLTFTYCWNALESPSFGLRVIKAWK